MIKKTVCLLLISLLIFPLSGCWNYRGLNEMSIVTGVAIDKDPKSGNYQLSFEVVDLSVPIKEEGLNGIIIESEGKTLFDAVRNAKKRVTNKLYFGQAQIVVVSEEIARSGEISSIINWLLRNDECRETTNVIISQEKTARDIIISKGIGQGIVSTEIQEIVESDKKVTSSTLSVELYKAFNILKAKGKSLALPAIHNVTNDGEPVVEVNGTAVFKDKKFIGYLTPDETKYYLFSIDEIKGGVLTFSSAGEGRDDVTLEISRNITKSSFDFIDGKVKILIHTDTTVYLDEVGHNDALDEKQIAALEDAAEAKLEYYISRVIQKVQSEYGSDIFGFGNMIYKKDLRLWNQLSDNWEEQFKVLEVEVQSSIQIINTGALEKS